MLSPISYHRWKEKRGVANWQWWDIRQEALFNWIIGSCQLPIAKKESHHMLPNLVTVLKKFKTPVCGFQSTMAPCKSFSFLAFSLAEAKSVYQFSRWKTEAIFWSLNMTIWCIIAFCILCLSMHIYNHIFTYSTTLFFFPWPQGNRRWMLHVA